MGKVHPGNCVPEDNLNCYDGKYAAHTGGGNSNSIGVALCGMLGYKNRSNIGNYPLTKIQCECAFKFIAELSKKYKIAITPETIMTHFEFGESHPETSSHGKPDISFLPPYSYLKAKEIGDFIRGKIRWYFNTL